MHNMTQLDDFDVPYSINPFHEVKVDHDILL